MVLTQPRLFTLIGALSAAVAVQIATQIRDPVALFYIVGLALVCGSFLLLWQKQSARQLLIFLSSLTALLFALIVWQHYRDTAAINSYAPFSLVALIQITVISTTFMQALRTQKPYYQYADLFENAWNNHFYVFFSILLSSGFLIILLLGTLLFDSINIEMGDFIWDKEVTPIIIGALLGLGIGISREHDSLIFRIRSVFFALFRILTYLTTVIVLLFALSLPFSISQLFSNDSTSGILLSLVIISILLLNSQVYYYQKADQSTSHTNKSDSDLNNIANFKHLSWVNYLFVTQIILLPVLALISVFAIYLRIEQYGLMPNRIIALTLAITLVIYGLTYVYQLIKHKADWAQAFKIANPPLAFLWVAILVLLLSPILDPIRLSVDDQVQRLKNNIVSAKDFDFYALDHNLGKLGDEALADMQTWRDHPEYDIITKWESHTARTKMAIMNILDQSLKSDDSEYIRKHYSHYQCNEKEPCYLLRKDVDHDNTQEIIVLLFNQSYTAEKNYTLNFHIYDNENTQQTWQRVHHISKGNNSVKFTWNEVKNLVQRLTDNPTILQLSR
ncbi:MAG TPA: DUF4153 domain-containing protein, partial [Thiothrix sp.]|nr:DUF4153 domain-containing protein [Thiothrix sp.]